MGIYSYLRRKYRHLRYPTVARIEGEIAFVCHCTHIDSEHDPFFLSFSEERPEPWTWVKDAEAEADNAEKERREKSVTPSTED